MLYIFYFYTMKKIFILCFILISFQWLFAQEATTRRDSLQGGMRVERSSFDVQHYNLNVKINTNDKTIVGFNEISFNVVENTSKIQLDLFNNMQVDSIIYNNYKLKYIREFDAVFIDFTKELVKNSSHKLKFYYSGTPKVAKNAPWDGGFVWKKDKNGNPFVGVAVQGTGASLWYPVKDSQSDEPDFGATINVAVPNGLMNVSNGRYLGKEDLNNGYVNWKWEVKNPINSYNIVINIADYVHISDKIDNLSLDYYVLRDNKEKAIKHFEEVKPMMKCFQEKFGEYPFIQDGYKLVETPYLGMEHQSAVAYGNQYLKGYLGNDISGTGVGLLFDFITIHETGHEWFGNSITSKDIADMWIHESFTTYSESVFIECEFGYDKAIQYINGQKKMIANKKPIIGQFGVNFKTGNSDMYYKGALMLNTIRHIINNDVIWWNLLKEYSLTFKHKIIETQDVILFFNNKSGIDLTQIINQYLNYKDLPVLEHRIENKKLQVRWKTDVTMFKMPIEYSVKNKNNRILITNNWATLPKVESINYIIIDTNKMLFNIDK